jgi:hypothetical protein
MSLKSFTTAARSSEERALDGLPVEVDIDGRNISFLPPSDGQFAIALAGTSDLNTTTEQAATQINFFFSLIEREEDGKHLRRRLFARDDDFGIEMIADIITYLMEEWSARPTKQPSDFLPSQSSAGTRSTAARRHRASTSST